jgi:hypothetical protein
MLLEASRRFWKILEASIDFAYIITNNTIGCIMSSENYENEAIMPKPRPPPLWNGSAATCAQCLTELKFYGSTFETVIDLNTKNVNNIVSLFICPVCLLIFQCNANKDRTRL